MRARATISVINDVAGEAVTVKVCVRLFRPARLLVFVGFIVWCMPSDFGGRFRCLWNGKRALEKGFFVCNIVELRMTIFIEWKMIQNKLKNCSNINTSEFIICMLNVTRIIMINKYQLKLYIQYEDNLTISVGFQLPKLKWNYK